MLKTQENEAASTVNSSTFLEASDRLQHLIADAAGLAGEFRALGSFLRATDAYVSISREPEIVDSMLSADWVRKATELVSSQRQLSERFAEAANDLVAVTAVLETNTGRSPVVPSLPEGVALQPSDEQSARSREIAEMLGEVWPDIEASMIYLRDK